jgi:F-type H+-transporting ATPase subunit a
MASFAPETIFQIGSFPVTNTILNTLFVDAVLLGSAFALKNKIKKVPGLFQNAVEILFQAFYGLTESIAGKNAQKIFPWFMTFFLFILIANWSGLLPGAGSVGFTEPHAPAAAHDTAKSGAVSDTHAPADDHAAPADPHATDTHAETDSHAAPATDTHGKTPVVDEKTATQKIEDHSESAKPHLTPIFRNATSELNVTLALALISLAATHIMAIRAVGIGEYLSRYFSINPILLFVGILEIVSEFTKIISLSFRLFGNIYAGEVVLHTISSLFAFLLPIPFMMLEIIVGLVQALVFAMLTMVFMSVLMTPHHAEEHAKEVSH